MMSAFWMILSHGLLGHDHLIGQITATSRSMDFWKVEQTFTLFLR